MFAQIKTVLIIFSNQEDQFYKFYSNKLAYFDLLIMYILNYLFYFRYCDCSFNLYILII